MLAGLVGGLNPCALSMLLVLLSALLTAGRGAGRYAAVYLAVKGVCYFLIGTVFLAAFAATDAAWLPARCAWRRRRFRLCWSCST